VWGVHRLRTCRHAAPAVLATALSLLVPFAATGGADGVTGTAGSATARAAAHEPVTAPDVRFALGGPAMTTARQIAETHWGSAPCSGQVEIVWAQLEPDTNATAAWRNPTDAWNNPVENFDCRIEFNAASDYDWPKLCTVMTHEMGHLVGQQHSARSGELMSPIYAEAIPVCNGLEPGAPAPAPAPVEADEEFVAFRKAQPSARATTAAKRTTGTKKAAKRKKAKRSKRCTRVFRSGRRVMRCKPQRKAGRTSRARR
jgi:hypothetical protein